MRISEKKLLQWIDSDYPDSGVVLIDERFGEEVTLNKQELEALKNNADFFLKYM